MKTQHAQCTHLRENVQVQATASDWFRAYLFIVVQNSIGTASDQI